MWTTKEISYLRENSHLGAEAIARHLHRTPTAIRLKARNLGVSLRRPGSRRGLLLGQPRGTRWSDLGPSTASGRLERLRSDVLSGKVHLPALYERIRRQMDESTVALCPSCTARPVEREQTGLCSVCHLRELARAHRDEDELQTAQRELWRARQERSRANRKASEQ